MPFRWMAPEAISDKLFTTQGDVWAYGVRIQRGRELTGQIRNSLLIHAVLTCAPFAVRCSAGRSTAVVRRPLM